MSEFADILQSLQGPEGAMDASTEPRFASRRFENSVHAFERALGGLVPPVGAHRASDAGSARPQARFALYAAGAAFSARGQTPARDAATPRATYA